MNVKFSKPASDIATEFDYLMNVEQELVEIVNDFNQRLKGYPQREHCLLCNVSLKSAENLNHRDTEWCLCSNCGHLQTKHHPDDSFEKAYSEKFGYSSTYTTIEEKQYLSRCERIYTPKAEWAIESLQKLELYNEDLSWLEIGCGAGYFLKALGLKGINNFQGLEIDQHNLELAQKMNDPEKIQANSLSFDQTIRQSNANIIVSFFVLEHVENLFAVIEALKANKKGTIFIFSVPVFGFVSMFEALTRRHCPRQMDGMYHVQMFTNNSLNYFLKRSGYNIVSEWVFGQDMMDVYRFFGTHLKNQYPESFLRNCMGKLSEMIDPVQECLDRAFFSDSRHIIAVKS